MVGVAGKSHGCNTCRKRKIRCDGRKPRCCQCQKSRRICGGYERDRFFKNLSALDHENLLARAQPIVSLTEPSWIRSENEDADSAVDRPQCPLRAEDILMQTRPSRRLLPSSTFTITQLFGRFIEDYIPRNSFTRREPHAYPSWWQVLADMAGQHESLDQAVAALSMVGLGLNYQDERLRLEGIKTYGRALDGMKQIIGRGGLVYQEQTLATSLVMLKFELFETSGESIHGWKSHISGLSHFIRLRGPMLHSSPLSHQLFLGLRPSEIIHALFKRKTTYLAEPSWLSIPWCILPKDDFHHLLDILARLTGLIEKSQQMLTSSPSINASPQRTSILIYGLQLEQELESWYDSIVTGSVKCLYTEIPTKKAVHDDLFPTMLAFESFELFRMHSFYWSALLLLYDTMHGTYDSRFGLNHFLKSTIQHHQIHEHSTETKQPFNIGDESSTASGMAFDDFNTDDLQIKRLEIATLIAKSVHFLVSQNMPNLGIHSVLFPLRIALHIFSQQPGPAAAWCRRKFEEFEKRGFPLAKFLSETRWDDFPALLS